MFFIRLCKIIWASPYTILGLTIGLLGLCSRGRVLRRWPLEFCDGGVCWLLEHLPSDYVMAMTLIALFPDADHRGGQTNLEDGNARVQFNYTDTKGDGVIHSLGVSVISNGNVDAIHLLKSVCDRFGLAMVDNQNGEIADFSADTQRSMASYSAFLDRNQTSTE